MRDRITSDVVGSYVVFDPTGRDLNDCMEVGVVLGVQWDSADDGTREGYPRPLLIVSPNGSNETIAVTTVRTVL